MTNPPIPIAHESPPTDALEENRRHLWGLCYRMTGNAADADELVQETFVRALEQPPARTDVPWRPWLVRVAIDGGLIARARQAAQFLISGDPGLRTEPVLRQAVERRLNDNQLTWLHKG